MDNSTFSEINTTLNLNGPILSFTSDPVGATGIGTTLGGTQGGTVSFTAKATASLLGAHADGTGYLSYQWYEVDRGKVIPTDFVTGAASTGPIGAATTLTVTNLITPGDNQRKFYVQADYVASAYQQDQLGIAKSTGNAWNEPLSSGVGTVTVDPLIEVVSQPPQGTQSLQNNNASIGIGANLTDTFYPDDVTYQWYVDGKEATDGLNITTTVTSEDVFGQVEETFTSNGQHIVQDNISGDVTVTIAGGAGGRGGNDGSGPGGLGGSGSAGKLTIPEVKAKGQVLNFKIGSRGNDGFSGTRSGGGNGGTVTHGADSSSATSVTFTVTKIAGGRNFVGTPTLRSPGNAYAWSTSEPRVITVDIPVDRAEEIHIAGTNVGLISFWDNWTRIQFGQSSGSAAGNDGCNITCNRGYFRSTGRALATDYTYQYPNFVPSIEWVSTSAVTSADDGDGGKGMNAGPRGWSGGGGGGGAATLISDVVDNVIAVAAGGGGGGGGSWHRGGYNAGQTNFSWTTYDSDLSNGGSTQDLSWWDGGGGGGGGGGAPGGSNGSRGQDRAWGSPGGNGGTSSALFGNWFNESSGYNGWSNPSAGYVNIKYLAKTQNEVTKTVKVTAGGVSTPTLTIRSDTVGIHTCQCKISSATASNSPIWSDVVNYVATTVRSEYNLNIENIGTTGEAALSSVDLGNGQIEFDTSQAQVSSGQITKYISIWAPDKDINVEMDIYGGKGADKGSYSGGEGGYSRIRFTIEQNNEYVITGLSTSQNTPFIYNKGALIACVGQGGDAGTAGNGGNGGGVKNEGQNGSGRAAGLGGIVAAEGTMGNNGTFGSAVSAPQIYPGDSQAINQDGGRTIRCTKGVYWAERGIPPCQDMTSAVGITRFRLPDGTPVMNSKMIFRGFKAGYNIMETAGNKSSNGGKGGNGATGGNGGTEGGGGGGSGYNNGSITVVTTQQGGSNGDAKVVLRLVT